MSEVLDLAIEFIDTPSPSRNEAGLCDVVERRLVACAHLTVTRVGDNLVARTSLGRARRVIVAGHLDTVSSSPPTARLVDGDLFGLGAVDMKGTLAAMVVLATTLIEPTVDVTWVFYAREEVARTESGLLEIAEAMPSLLDADAAILGEPTGGAVEAGCQGTLRLVVRLGGVKAHTARPHAGVNAIHRAGPLLAALVAAPVRRVELDGVTFAEQLQVVDVRGGVGHNVVPDEVEITINHRFAPDRTVDEAEQFVRDLIAPHLDATLGDVVTLADGAPGAVPGLDDEVLARLVALSDAPVAAKVGWTDVATFAARGMPAANFGAGDPLLAHHPDEHVGVDALDGVTAVLRSLLSDPSLA